MRGASFRQRFCNFFLKKLNPTKLNDAKEGLLQDKAGTASVDYTAKTTNLMASILKNYADLGIEKVTGEAGNSGQTPPNEGGALKKQPVAVFSERARLPRGQRGYGKEHPDNGNNGGGNDPNDGVTTNGADKPDKFIYYYHPDHLGSSSYISNALGEVVQHIEYFAFGETFLEEHSNTDRTPYLFNGKELDEETGLYYYGARYYDPRTSIWLSVDPLAVYNPIFEVEHYIDGQHNGGVFNSGNLNVYGYTYQNPINYIDPNGKQNKSWIEVLGEGLKELLYSLSDKKGDMIQYERVSKGQRTLTDAELADAKSERMRKAVNKINYSASKAIPREWILNNKSDLLYISDVTQDVGDGMAVAGYALTLTIIGAEIGPELAAAGNIVSGVGQAIEFSVYLAESDFDEIASDAGYIVAEELANMTLKKVPGVDSKRAKQILQQNVNLKITITERLIENENKDE